jgi:putative peptide zinc metalloprotease protein
MSTAATKDASKAFPKLRQDLVFSSAPQESNQPAMFVLTDLVRHKFFHLGQDELAELAQAAPFKGEATPLVNFLAQNELIEQSETGSWKAYAEKSKRLKKGLLTSALHGYLYFRIPLINPLPLQKLLWPFVALFFTNLFLITTLLAGLFGLFFASRHWDQFSASFASLLTFSGLSTYALAFAFIKLLHEAGHAFMAYRYRVAVPSVGIAFMMFAPVLYTETSAAWCLPKKQRMMIGAAGMMVELMLAMWASLFWAFVPDGATRAILFAIATTGWFLTLAVNLNPLMRFDGYFLASDLVSMPNLQDRSFAMARWALRETLFGVDEPKPEEFSRPKTIALVAFAVATWIYRLFLYLGLALLVYHFAIKLLGIFLFIVEIAWFIVLPLWRETKHWWTHRTRYFSTNAARKSALMATMLVVLFFMPLSRTITTPALLTAAQFEQIHTKTDAIVMTSNLIEGRPVVAGEPLLELALPDLDFELAKANSSIQNTKTKLLRLASDNESRSQTQVLQEEMARALQTRQGILELANNRIVRAPFDGITVNVEPAISRDRWIGPTTLLAIIKTNNGAEIQSIATDSQVNRIKKGAVATFYPDDFMLPKVKAKLVEIEDTGSDRLAYAELADINGGTVSTKPAPNGEVTPSATYTKLRIAPDLATLSIPHTQRGIVRIQASGESLATRFLRRIAAVLIMESGF